MVTWELVNHNLLFHHKVCNEAITAKQTGDLSTPLYITNTLLYRCRILCTLYRLHIYTCIELHCTSFVELSYIAWVHLLLKAALHDAAISRPNAQFKQNANWMSENCTLLLYQETEEKRQLPVPTASLPSQYLGPFYGRVANVGLSTSHKLRLDCWKYDPTSLVRWQCFTKW